MKKTRLWRLLNSNYMPNFTVFGVVFCLLFFLSCPDGLAQGGDSSALSQQAAIAELLAKSSGNSQVSQSRATVSPSVPKRQAISQSAGGSATGTIKGTRAPEKLVRKNPFGNSSLSRAAFINVLNNVMPLTPTQVQTLKRLFLQSNKAVDQYPGTPPKSTSSTVLVSLSPGASPPVIRLRSGFISSLVFLDSTGQPWPIRAFDNGNPRGFDIQWDQKGNPATLLVQSNGGYQNANIAVLLRGNPTPVMLTFVPGQRAVDYRVDLRIPGLGPNASMSMGRLPSAASPQLLSVLNGVGPNGAKRLQVDGGNAEAWSLGGHLYLKTRLTLMSPSWISTMSSPDGTNAYELVKTPVVLASRRGSMVHLTIKGW